MENYENARESDFEINEMEIDNQSEYDEMFIAQNEMIDMLLADKTLLEKALPYLPPDIEMLLAVAKDEAYIDFWVDRIEAKSGRKLSDIERIELENDVLCELIENCDGIAVDDSRIDSAISNLEKSIALEIVVEKQAEERAAAWEHYRKTGIKPQKRYASSEKCDLEMFAELSVKEYMYNAGIKASGAMHLLGRKKEKYTRYALSCLKNYRLSGDKKDVRSAYWYLEHRYDVDEVIIL